MGACGGTREDEEKLRERGAVWCGVGWDRELVVPVAVVVVDTDVVVVEAAEGGREVIRSPGESVVVNAQ